MTETSRLHLIKLSVGSGSVENMARWQAGRVVDYEGERAVPVFTRMRPRREAEILDGGSIYWVIKHRIVCRQRILGLEEGADNEGRAFCLLMLDPHIIETRPKSKRPFQGWRYLKQEDAPADLTAAERDAADMPQDLQRELRALGVL